MLSTPFLQTSGSKALLSGFLFVSQLIVNSAEASSGSSNEGTLLATETTTSDQGSGPLELLTSPLLLNHKGVSSALLMGISQSRDRYDDDRWGWISGGRKGDAVSGALGFRSKSFGIELGFVDRAEVNPFNFFQGPPPFFVAPIGVFNTLPLLGFDLLAFTGNGTEKISLFGGVGMYFQQRTLIGEVTGAYYKLGEQNLIRGSLSAGLLFNITDSFRVGGSYHTERGPQLILSFRL